MLDQPPQTQTVRLTTATQQLDRVLDRVFRKEARVLVENDGVPVAAIVSTEDLRRLEALDAEDREAWRILEAMRAPFKDVPIEEIERETAATLAEVRAEMTAERKRAAGARA